MTKFYEAYGIGSIGIFRLHDFTLDGVFLLSSEGAYFRCPELNIHEAHIHEELQRIAPFAGHRQTKRLPGSFVLLSGPGHNVYGHWLVEYLPKISLLDFTGYDIHSLRYLLPEATPSYVFNWLELIGISADQIIRYDIVADSLIVEELIVPTILHNGVRMSPIFKDAAAFIQQQVMARPDFQQRDFGARICLARPKGSRTRALSNRARIQELVTQSGFSLVYPEELSLSDQLCLFVNAREIIGEYGSALHGTLFSPAGTVVCALRGTASHPGFIQSGIGTVLQQPTGYVFGGPDDSDISFGFQIDETTLATAIRLAFNSGLSLK